MFINNKYSCYSEKVIICFYHFHSYAKFVMCIVNVFFKLFFQVLKIVWSPIRDWLYFTLLRIFHICHFEKNITVLKMTSKSSPPYSPNIIFNSLITILAVNTNSINWGFQENYKRRKLHRSVCYSSPGLYCLNKSSRHYIAATLFNIRKSCAITQRNHFQYQGDRGDNLIQSLLTYQFIILTLFYKS